MRYTLLALIALCLVAFAPKPKVRVGVVAVDSATVAMTVTASGRLKSGDFIRYNFWKGTSIVTTTDTTALSFVQVLPAPTCGTASEYWVAARLSVGGVLQKAVESNKVTHQAAACPEQPSVIDSVRITPATVSLAPGGSVQFSVAVS